MNRKQNPYQTELNTGFKIKKETQEQHPMWYGKRWDDSRKGRERGFQETSGALFQVLLFVPPQEFQEPFYCLLSSSLERVAGAKLLVFMFPSPLERASGALLHFSIILCLDRPLETLLWVFLFK